MDTTVNRIKNIVETLQKIVDEAESRGVTKIATNCNTYGLNRFVSLGYDGFLDLDADVDDLIEDDEED